MVESERAPLQALHGLALLDTPPEERFDRFTRIAVQLFGVDIALVSLVDEERQWFKSHQGLALTQTCREESLCAHAIQTDGIFEVAGRAGVCVYALGRHGMQSGRGRE